MHTLNMLLFCWVLQIVIHQPEPGEDGKETGALFKHGAACLAVPDSPGRCCSVHSWRRSRHNPASGNDLFVVVVVQVAARYC